MRNTLISSLLTLGLASQFSGAALAQDNQDCSALDLLNYDLSKNNQTLQSSGLITSETDSDAENHRFEFYANSNTGHWTFIEIKGEEDNQEACKIANGTIFVHEAPQQNDGQKTKRQSITALHGGGDSSNEAYEIYAHQGTDRWFITRRISADKSQVILAGKDFHEENNTPTTQMRRINYTHQ